MTPRLRITYGLWFGVILSALFITVNLLAEKLLHVPLLPFAMFDWMAVALPGDVVTFGLDLMIDVVQFLNIGRTSEVGKTAEQVLALLIFFAIGGGVGMLLGWRESLNNFRPSMGIVIALTLPTIGLMLWFPIEEGWRLVNIAYFVLAMPLFILSIPYLLLTLDELPGSVGEDDDNRYPMNNIMTRRIFLTNMSFRAGVFIVGFGAARFVLDQILVENAKAGIALLKRGQQLYSRPSTDDFTPAPGTRPEVSDMDTFYVIDKNILRPNVDAAGWELVVQGAVDNRLRFTYDDILNREAFDFYATLMCISNDVGGDLIDNTVWTGVRLRDVLLEAGLQSGVKEIKFLSSDGFYETMPIENALDERTMLCYGMGGESLTVTHGFPLRVYSPGLYGMKQPKWLHTIEAIREIENGYWTDRNWTKEGHIKMTTIIDPVEAEISSSSLAIGGIAFSGDKGISRVEVRVDRQPWQEAELRTPLSPLTWVQWRVDVPFLRDGEEHIIQARAFNADGLEQISQRSGSRPDGATGYHEVEVKR